MSLVIIIGDSVFLLTLLIVEMFKHNRFSFKKKSDREYQQNTAGCIIVQLMPDIFIFWRI